MRSFGALRYDPVVPQGRSSDIRAWAVASPAGFARLTERHDGTTSVVTVHARRGVP